MGEIRPEQIIKIPLKAVEEPYNGINEVYLDRWWSFDPREQSLIFYRMHKGASLSAQCNDNEVLAAKIHQSVWAKHDFMLKKVPRVFIPQTSIYRSGEMIQVAHIAPIIKRLEENKVTFFMAECQAGCEPPLPMPFSEEEKRDNWAAEHLRGAHNGQGSVKTYTEDRY